MSVNVENIKKAITVMERVRDYEAKTKKRVFDLQWFQSCDDDDDYKTLETEEEVLHSCGTTCCFVGWLAVSPEFRDMGFGVDSYGAPTFEDDSKSGEFHLKHALGLSDDEYNGMVFGGYRWMYYGKPIDEVMPEDVINQLKQFIPKE